MALAYPVNLNIAGWSCLVVGGGTVGARRAESLANCEARVTVVALSADKKVRDLSKAGIVRLLIEPFMPTHLEGMRLVIAATNSDTVNEAIGTQCRKRNILVNRADDAAEGDFAVPATVRRGALTLTVATDGSHPRLTTQIAKALEATYGPEYEPYVAMLRMLRLEILAESAAYHERDAAFNALNEREGDFLHLIRSGQEKEALHAARQTVSSAIHSVRSHHVAGKHDQ